MIPRLHWRFRASQHAVERWNERCSHYDSTQSIFSALRESEEIIDKSTLPFKLVTEGRIYLYHPPKEAYFVIEMSDDKWAKVITVMTAKGIKKKKKPPKPEKKPKPEVTPEQLLAAQHRAVELQRAAEAERLKQSAEEMEMESHYVALKSGRPESFAGIYEHWEWTKSEFNRLSRVQTTETDPMKRKVAKRYLTDLAAERGKIKPLFLEWRKVQEAAEPLYRPNGDVNFAVAAKLLLERTERQADEIAELKKRIEILESKVGLV